MIIWGGWANSDAVAWLESQSYWMSQKLCFILYPGKRNYLASSGNAPAERGSAINNFSRLILIVTTELLVHPMLNEKLNLLL